MLALTKKAKAAQEREMKKRCNKQRSEPDIFTDVSSDDTSSDEDDLNTDAEWEAETAWYKEQTHLYPIFIQVCLKLLFCVLTN